MKREQVFEFFRRLAEANPSPTTELDIANPYQLLVAVVLSAQATDASVNIASRPLFERVTRPQQMLAFGEERLARGDQDHRPVQHQGQERDRAQPGADRRHGGEVPRTREELEALPGVGRKTANVVLNTAFGEPRRSRSTPMCSGSATAPASRRARTPTRSSEAGKIVPRAVPPRRAPLADPARPLHLQGAAARMLALPGDRSLPLQAQDAAAASAHTARTARRGTSAARTATARTASRRSANRSRSRPSRLPEARRGVAADGNQVHRDPAEHRQRTCPRKRRAACDEKPRRYPSA